MLGNFGWSSGQFGCLDSLWTKESGWNAHATNGSSGAYGIPQSLPGSKMASAGSDWQTNPATQINWGLQYIKYVYGSPAPPGATPQAARTGTDRHLPAALVMTATRTPGRVCGSLAFPGRYGAVPAPQRGGRAMASRSSASSSWASVSSPDCHVAPRRRTTSRIARRSAMDSLATAAAAS